MVYPEFDALFQNIFFRQMNMVYRDILAKQQEEIKLEQQGKRKYEYDSDEDTEVNQTYLDWLPNTI